MTWDPRTSCGQEQDKIAALVVPYVQGRSLDLGCGTRKVWPSLIGVDNGHVFGHRTAADVHCEIDDLSIFGDGTMDAVFSSHALEDFPREKVPAVLREWARVLKVGGYLCLYVPSANLYPKCGEPGANPDHKWDIYPGDVEAMLREMAEPYEVSDGGTLIRQHPAFGWELVESEERDQDNEYSLFIVARKTEAGWRENVWQRHPGGRKRALVIRYGGIGDMIMASSILPLLQEQGYHITLNCKEGTDQVLRHNPHIDQWIVQANNFVPNEQLGPYWHTLAQRYDRVINLCESIEGALLMLGERLQSQYPDACRRKIAGGVNYVERTHDIADVPHVFDPRFHPTEFERDWAKAEVRQHHGGPVIAWALNGSSPHKIWPWVHVVSSWLLKQVPFPAHIYFLADGLQGKELQTALIEKMSMDAANDMTRIHGMAGRWTIRQTLAFVQQCHVVVGPETGVLNAVCMEQNAKVIYLSHSSPTNLTRDWINTTVLEPVSVPCWPCHRLHHTFATCHQDEATGSALCAASVSPERVFEAIGVSLGARKAA